MTVKELLKLGDNASYVTIVEVIKGGEYQKAFGSPQYVSLFSGYIEDVPKEAGFLNEEVKKWILGTYGFPSIESFEPEAVIFVGEEQRNDDCKC